MDSIFEKEHINFDNLTKSDLILINTKLNIKVNN